ncbi:error-prone DNA polymerase [Vibrio mediterranei]|uniref:error-prone DNA polymerase n=1 Tax=Vibrio TaxID=662 RepID=UPI001801BA54|nr:MULTISPECIES: error-prone DNA polymerase [Vibrio]MDA0108293.1 error-prone DNA polymerase [Vibrio sp. La 4.2.2]NUW71824.1 error-prone DNA polymerase [Vibrio mediterranei]
MKYAELFCQSNFSFLTGASHAEELVLQAEFLQYSAIAITDECSIAGAVRAHTAIKQHGLSLKQIVGSMFWLNDECQFILLSPTREAYAELCRIITNARRRCEKGDYQLSEWDIMSLRHCLILWLPTGRESDVRWGRWLVQYHHQRLWIGLQRHLTSNEHRYIQHCETLSVDLQLPITACGGVLMHTATRLPLQHTLTAIKLNTSIEKVCSHLLVNTERSLRPKTKLEKLYRSEWLNESVYIASLCEFKLSKLRYEYPSELIPNGKTPMGYLRELVERGKAQRFPEGLPSHVEQTINKELALIEELDYPFFFLTIHDIVMFAKQQGILYQGRGSAANSIVCYCLEITAVDPRQISVLFERFISKERNEPPDIDVDFEHERREEVIQYIYQKYGRERAALAATVISYRFKSAVRDVGKALGVSDTQLDYFIKNINRRDRSQGWQAQLIELGLKPDSLKGQQFIELVNEITGFPRHLSQHVGGFVISSGPLYELVPVENAAMAERTVIQWDKDDLESLGLLKVDVLALGMLTAIRKCFQLINKHYGRTLTIADITRRQDDPNVYAMIQRADTIGVFQIESRAQMSMLPRLKPATYYDLVIQIAIVRPGPIQGDMVHPFLKRRNGEEAISYPSKEVESVLSRTLGVPIFQEQVIKLAMVAAGFTGGEADQLRRAMAAWKKNGDLFKFRSKLIQGMQAKGYETEFAERLFEQICGFGEYGFPESHSASFAVLAYCSAWLKHYYPDAFYTALLNSLPMGFYSSSQLLQDAKRHHVSIAPVCVNYSQYHHYLRSTPQGLVLQLGFRQVNGLSESSMQRLLQHRPREGFTTATQIKQLGLNRRELEILASANALKAISGHRYATRWAMMDNLQDLPLFKAEKSDDSSLPHQPSPIEDMLEDFSAMNVSLNQHPITLLDQAGKLGRFTRMRDLTLKPHKSLVTVVGTVTGKQSPGTAAGVTFFTLEDDTGNINVVVWQATARAQKKQYLTAKILKVKGILEREGQVIHVIAGRLIDMTEQLSDLKIQSREFH